MHFLFVLAFIITSLSASYDYHTLILDLCIHSISIISVTGAKTSECLKIYKHLQRSDVDAFHYGEPNS